MEYINTYDDISTIHTRNNYLNNFIFNVKNPTKEEIALYGKVIFKYNTRQDKTRQDTSRQDNKD
jgi:hypothetical protein